jgi:pilus assembly protein CpaB
MTPISWPVTCPRACASSPLPCIAGFVFPGDHVDLIYTHDVERVVSTQAANGSALPVTQKETSTVSETLLTNVKVLAVDQRSSNAGAVDKNGALLIPRSTSLMVSQVDAQRVRLAQKTGSLSMVLRAMADRESADALILTQKSDISQGKTADVETQDAVRVLRGAPKGFSETSNSATSTLRAAPPISGAAPALNPASVAP